ncbi:MAG: transposase [Pseudomonadota bacterium]
MPAQGLEWGEATSIDVALGAGRQAVAEILRARMVESVDRHLAAVAEKGVADRRNGSYTRHLLTEPGDIELAVPRTRRFHPRTVVRA